MDFFNTKNYFWKFPEGFVEYVNAVNEKTI